MDSANQSIKSGDGRPAAAVPRSPIGYRILSLLHQFSLNEWRPAEAILENQLDRLRHLLIHAVEHVPYQRQRFEAAGYRLDRLKQGRLSLDQWRTLAPMARAEVQEAGDKLYADQVPRDHGRVTETSSSGSTGRPVTIRRTQHASLFWHALFVRQFQWHRMDPMLKRAIIRRIRSSNAEYPQGRVAPNWGPTFALLNPSGSSPFLNIETDIALQAEWLSRQNPDYLLTAPTNLGALARHCAHGGINYPRLKCVETSGELLDPDVRTLVRDTFGLSVKDLYSAQEVGYIALQCPDFEHYHVQSDSILVEVLDDDNNPCPPGATGKVVVTPLHNYATPLFRYEIGDYAEVGKPCPCGRGYPVLKRILGRARNMMIGPDGEQIWPSFSSRSFTGVAPVLQHQIVQHTVDTLEAKLVTQRPLSPDEEAALEEVITARLLFPMKVSFSYHAEIPRSAGGKYEDFVSHVSANP